MEGLAGAIRSERAQKFAGLRSDPNESPVPGLTPFDRRADPGQPPWGSLLIFRLNPVGPKVSRYRENTALSHPGGHAIEKGCEKHQ